MYIFYQNESDKYFCKLIVIYNIKSNHLKELKLIFVLFLF